MTLPVLNFLLCLASVPIGKEAATIPWDAGRKLTWEDFRGRPDKSSSFYASTAYAIDCETEWIGDSIQFRVVCAMQPGESWLKKEAKSDALLKHEQLHFDIAELYTRKLRKELAQYAFTAKSVDKSFRSITDKNSRERESAQRLYDKETRHSLNEATQQAWEERVAGELKEMAAYDKVEFKVYVKSP